MRRFGIGLVPPHIFATARAVSLSGTVTIADPGTLYAGVPATVTVTATGDVDRVVLTETGAGEVWDDSSSPFSGSWTPSASGTRELVAQGYAGETLVATDTLEVAVGLWSIAMFFTTNPPVRSWDLHVVASRVIDGSSRVQTWDESIASNAADQLTASTEAKRPAFSAADAALAGMPSAANPADFRFMTCVGASAIAQRWSRLVIGIEPPNNNGYWVEGGASTTRAAVLCVTDALAMVSGSLFTSTIASDTSQGSIVVASGNGDSSTLERWRFDGSHDEAQTGNGGAQGAKGLSIFGRYDGAGGSTSKVVAVLDFAGAIDVADMANFLAGLEARYGVGPF